MTRDIVVTAPVTLRPWSLLRDFQPWCASQRSQTSPIDEAKPWLTYRAIRYLRRKVKRRMNVYEFGSGGSTLYFHRNGCNVVTCEHDPIWAAKVREALVPLGVQNAPIKIIEAAPDPDANLKDPKNPGDYTSHFPGWQGLNFERYVRSIDDYPDGAFDVILVDGRSRPSCVKHAIPKLASPGILILDNAERPVYAAVKEMLKPPRFRRRDFYGPGSINIEFWLTSVWEQRGTGR